MHPMYRIRALAVAGTLLGGVPAAAATFCVTTADELTAALATAQQDATANHEIRIHTGHYLAPAGGWHIDVEQRGIRIGGGFFGESCADESLDASQTVLDGHNEVRPLTIDTSFVFQNSLPEDIVVRGLTFANGLGERAGGLKVSDAGPIANGTILIERNIFRDNIASVYEQDNSAGGLLAATDGPDFSGNVFLTVRNNLFVGNRAPDGAAALLFSNNSIVVSDNTVVGNQSFEPTLASREAVATFTFSHRNYANNVFWGNNPDALDETYDLRADNPFAAGLGADLWHNDLQAVHGMPGTDVGNLAVDPLFAAAAQDDFHLAPASPLVNSGTDTPEGDLTSADLDGSDRRQGMHVDIGAFESDVLLRAPFE